MYNTLCTSCFADRGAARTCPSCGFEEPVELHLSGVALPPRTMLEHYLVGRTLKKPGRFGLTYVGWDANLHMRVIISEFLPVTVATRAAGGLDVVPISADDAAAVARGIEAFLADGRKLRQIDHPNVARVLAAFRAHNTAYLVTEYRPAP